MPHARCRRCRARVWHEPSREEHPAALCPGCGSELEAVTDLSELVGLRALRTRPRLTHADSHDQFDRISEQIRDAVDRRRAERRPRLDSTGR